jgi:hypothetical protein
MCGAAEDRAPSRILTIDDDGGPSISAHRDRLLVHLVHRRAELRVALDDAEQHADDYALGGRLGG